jgi:hypothetical protein
MKYFQATNFDLHLLNISVERLEHSHEFRKEEFRRQYFLSKADQVIGPLDDAFLFVLEKDQETKEDFFQFFKDCLGHC